MGKRKKCPTCGRPFYTRSKYCCYACGMPAVEDAIRQLQAKKGGIYDKWKRNLKKSLKRL